jgi:hypothetical protein
VELPKRKKVHNLAKLSGVGKKHEKGTWQNREIAIWISEFGKK